MDRGIDIQHFTVLSMTRNIERDATMSKQEKWQAFDCSPDAISSVCDEWIASAYDHILKADARIEELEAERGGLRQKLKQASVLSQHLQRIEREQDALRQKLKYARELADALVYIRDSPWFASDVQAVAREALQQEGSDDE